MKRPVSLLLALSLVLALTACGSKADGAADAAAGSPPRYINTIIIENAHRTRRH